MKLIFVYNSDSGFFNTAGDIAHKIFSPSTYTCRLCDLTHGYFNMTNEWKEFIKKIDIKCEFLHRDEFINQHGNLTLEFPAILKEVDGNISVFISMEEIQNIHSLKDLINEVNAKI